MKRLSECEARITDCHWGDDLPVTKMLWFTWEGHEHAVPYSSEGVNIKGSNCWKHVSGDTIEDVTLAPSYFCKAPAYKVLHCFIRDGAVHPV